GGGAAAPVARRVREPLRRRRRRRRHRGLTSAGGAARMTCGAGDVRGGAMRDGVRRARAARGATVTSVGLAVALGAAGCVADAPAEAPVLPTASFAPEPGPGTPPVAFAWTDLRGRPLSTASMRGRVTVLAFIATYDVASQ